MTSEHDPDAGSIQTGTLTFMTGVQQPRGFQRVTIEVDVWVGHDAHASAWIVADNVQIEMTKACEAVAKELGCPDEGIEVVVK